MEEIQSLPKSLFKSKRERTIPWLLPSSWPPFSWQCLPLADLAVSQSSREPGKRSLRGSDTVTEKSKQVKASLYLPPFSSPDSLSGGYIH